MEWIVVLFIAVLLGAALVLYDRKRLKSLSPLIAPQFNFGKRRVTMAKTIELLEQRSAATLVETGIARYGLQNTRSDGASTIVFGKWAKENNAQLYSVDIDPEATANAKKCLKEMALDKAVEVYTEDSVQFLNSFDRPVDFLYLDSYDYSRKDKSVQVASQEHHLKEIKAIESRLHDKSFILIDDCRLPNGGKGKLVLDYLSQRGWKILLKRYQYLLVRDL